jgi:hypothetical protein
MTKKFKMLKYNQDQIVDALTCPVNRHCTRVEHGCDDWEMYKHPEWLLEHYIRCGGAKEFAKRRQNQEYWEEQEDKQDELEKQKKEIPTVGSEEGNNKAP